MITSLKVWMGVMILLLALSGFACMIGLVKNEDEANRAFCMIGAIFFVIMAFWGIKIFPS